MQDGQFDPVSVPCKRIELPRQSPTDFVHDLRNSLGSMQSALDVISLDSDISAQSSDMLAILQRQLDLMIQLGNAFADGTSPTVGE